MDAPDPPPPAPEPLLAYLETHEEPCPVCGYSLHRLPSARCPECGLELVLRVGLKSPPFGWFLLYLTPMIMVAGIGVLFLSLACVVGPPGRGLQQLAFYGLIGVGLIDAALLWPLYQRRATFYRRTVASQRHRVICIWVLHCLVVTGFVVSLS